MAANAHLPTAVLIDGENIATKDFPALQEIAKTIPGVAITRVFGDFANSAHANWLEVCKNHGLEPVLHCSAVAGKNGTDMLITISAMDILYAGKFRRLVLVSGDSDFLPLVRRLRAGGLDVVGIGRKPATGAACSAYSMWLELADPSPKQAAKPKPQTKTASTSQVPPGFRKAVQKIIGDSALSLSAIGKALRDMAPELAPPPGKGKLKKQIIAAGVFQLDGDLVRMSA